MRFVSTPVRQRKVQGEPDAGAKRPTQPKGPAFNPASDCWRTERALGRTRPDRSSESRSREHVVGDRTGPSWTFGKPVTGYRVNQLRSRHSVRALPPTNNDLNPPDITAGTRTFATRNARREMDLSTGGIEDLPGLERRFFR